MGGRAAHARNVSEQDASFAKTVFIYSGFWALGALLILLCYTLDGRSWFWNEDGLFQHYSAFNYVCESVESLLGGSGFSFFSYTIGQGADLIGTLSTYDFADPVCWLTALILPLSRPVRYLLMCLIKLYLAGFSFIVLCRAMGRRAWIPVVCGAIAYTFSGAVVIVFDRHPNFVNWVYFLPLLIAGAEHFLRTKRSLPFIGVVFLNAVVSIYTLYIDLVLLAVYVAIRGAFTLARNPSRETLLGMVGSALKLAGMCVIGFLLAAVVLLPTVYAYSVNARMPHTLDGAWFRGLDFAVALVLSTFMANWNPGSSTNLALNPFLFILIVMLFLVRRKNTELKVLLVLVFVLMCVPLWGQLMNGFSYSSNRWSFVVPLIASMALVDVFPELRQPTSRQALVVLAAALAFFGLVLAALMYKGTVARNAYMLVTGLLIVVFAFVYLGFARAYADGVGRAILALVVCGSCFQVVCTYEPFAGGYLKEFYTNEQVASLMTDESSTAAKELGDGFYRIDSQEHTMNKDGHTGVHGTGLWWSLIPATVSGYYTDMELCSVKQNCQFRGLDGRTGLLALASAAYYTKPAGEVEYDEPTPVGYQQIDSPDKDYLVYQNPTPLPLGYTYKSYIPSKDFEALSGVEREFALLQGAVVEEPIEGLHCTRFESPLKSLSYEVVSHEGIDLGEDYINVEDTSGAVKLSVDVPPESVVFLRIGNPRVVKGSRLSVIAKRSRGAYVAEKETTFSPMGYRWHDARKGMTFCLGSGGSGLNEITLTFTKRDRLTMEGIEVLAAPISAYNRGIEALGEHVLEGIDLGQDYVHGKITVPDDRILQFSIPFSIGWSATVDGEAAEVVRSDGIYLAVPIHAGTHEVHLCYRTPYLFEGLVVSAVTLVVLLSIAGYRRMRAGQSARDA